MLIKFQGEVFDTAVEEDLEELQVRLERIDTQERAKRELAALFKPKNAGTN